MAYYSNQPPKDHAPAAIPDKFPIKRYPAKRAWAGSDTFVKRGGTMHGTTQVVTSGNGIGCVPQAFCAPEPDNRAWLAVKYR